MLANVSVTPSSSSTTRMLATAGTDVDSGSGTPVHCNRGQERVRVTRTRAWQAGFAGKNAPQFEENCARNAPGWSPLVLTRMGSSVAPFYAVDRALFCTIPNGRA